MNVWKKGNGKMIVCRKNSHTELNIERKKREKKEKNTFGTLHSCLDSRFLKR